MNSISTAHELGIDRFDHVEVETWKHQRHDIAKGDVQYTPSFTVWFYGETVEGSDEGNRAARDINVHAETPKALLRQLRSLRDSVNEQITLLEDAID